MRSLTLTCFALLIACEPEPKPLPELPDIIKPVSLSSGPEREARYLTLALVAEVRGELDVCGCPTLPFGGFERRSALLDQLRSRGLPLIHVDAGHMLVRGFTTGGRGDAQDRAEILLDLAELVDLRVWAPSPGDLIAVDQDFLQKSLSEHKLQAVSATWESLPASTVIEEDGVKIGIIGLSAPPTSEPWRSEISYTEPELAVQLALAELPEDLDLVVGLSNLADDQNDSVSELLPLVLSAKNTSYDDPRSPNKGLVVEVPDRGRYLSVLTLRLASDPTWPLELNTAPADTLKRRAELSDTVRRLEEDPGLDPLVLKTAREQLTSVESLLETQGAGRNLAHFELIPLGAQLEGAGEISTKVDSFLKETTTEAQRKIDQQALVEEGVGYVSSSACFSCHNKQFSRWTLTAHAKAWDSMLARGTTENPDCIACHSTGFGEPGGWAEPTVANLRRFKGVQCESCHGPLMGHPRRADVRPAVPNEQTCVKCHTPEQDPDFDFERDLLKVSPSDKHHKVIK